VKVKAIAEDGELYVFAAKVMIGVTKENAAMRRRQLKCLWKRLRQQSPQWGNLGAKSCL